MSSNVVSKSSLFRASAYGYPNFAMKVDAIDHIHIDVENLDRAIPLFAALTGSDYREAARPDGMKSRLAWNDLIDLRQPISYDSSGSGDMASRIEDVYAIAFHVKGIADKISELKSRGLRLMSRTELKGKMITAQLAPENFLGLAIELVERLDGNHSRPIDVFHQVVEHLCIHVQNLDQAIQLFTVVTGHGFSAPRVDDSLHARISTNPLGLRLVQPLSGEGPIARDITLRGEGVAAIVLRVPNLEGAVAALQTAGFESTTPAQYDNVQKRTYAESVHAFGINIQLVEQSYMNLLALLA